MADITKCTNKECPLSSSCYRIQAKDSFYQYYSFFEYKDNKCNHYWKMAHKPTSQKL